MRTPTSRRSYRSNLLIIALVSITTWATAEAGFFSRLASLRVGDDDAKNDITIKFENGVAFAGVWNTARVPLVGFGVADNVEPRVIPTLVAEAIQADKGTRLVDVSPFRGTEALVAEGILVGVQNMQLSQKLEVHVVTKVWYTHFGYARTKLAVEESLRAFSPVINSDKVDLHLHFLLNWPRCFDNVYFMNCQLEETNLPQYIKDAGPDPTSNPAGAWKESWKLLEDMYMSEQHPIESIGVANFRLQDLQEFSSFAKMKPGIIQVNLWSLIYDHQLIRYCHENDIHVQVYNIMQRTLMHPEMAPHAYHHIQQVAVELSSKAGPNYSPSQILCAWLVQHGVSIVPGSSNIQHVADNSAVGVTSVSTLSNEQVETMAHAVEAYLSGKDIEFDTPVLVSFRPTTKDIMVYWMHDVDEVKLGLVENGQVFRETTYPGHFFRFYDSKNKDMFLDYQVQANIGSHVTVYVDLESRSLSAESTINGVDEL